MTAFTITQLTGLLRECAGEDDTVDLSGDVLDTAFADLGYDSLALLQTTGCIERDHGVTIDEDAVSEAETPRQYLVLVNEALSVKS
ncbi:acyl carrier protein [Streptomyces sp. BE308]|uniref:acyl carrier protein n=1 Tax=unclassified Streptomyces TaxID=2593676 RepID=UPI002DD90E0B|nr:MULTISPECIES: acyl carrier protein [unclassified Streptomyces]MEE1790008.1 acyl carrier protein [Streptomyces sp. BE308]WRZ77041.1 acyl carrier protein [Streptomyces sp. NBC_01237]